MECDSYVIGSLRLSSDHGEAEGGGDTPSIMPF